MKGEVMATAATKMTAAGGPQSATIRILNGVAEPMQDVSAWIRFGEVKFFNEDFEDYLILLVPKDRIEQSVALTLLARSSVSFTTPEPVELDYSISVKSDPTHLGEKRSGGGSIAMVIGGPVKGGGK
jgi:hypothetical protein